MREMHSIKNECRAKREDTGLFKDICNYCIVNVNLLLRFHLLLVDCFLEHFLRMEEENFLFVVGDTNKACYGLHNIVFEIIINFKSERIPFKRSEEFFFFSTGARMGTMGSPTDFHRTAYNILHNMINNFFSFISSMALFVLFFPYLSSCILLKLLSHVTR